MSGSLRSESYEQAALPPLGTARCPDHRLGLQCHGVWGWLQPAAHHHHPSPRFHRSGSYHYEFGCFGLHLREFGCPYIRSGFTCVC